MRSQYSGALTTYTSLPNTEAFVDVSVAGTILIYPTEEVFGRTVLLGGPGGTRSCSNFIALLFRTYSLPKPLTRKT